MRLYVIRHADPDYPNHTITEDGREESRLLAERFGKLDPPLTHVYSSPLNRAKETAQPTADVVGLPVTITGWLTEFENMSKLEDSGYNLWDVHGYQVRAADEVLATDWQDYPPFNAPDLLERWEGIETGSDALLANHGLEHRGNGTYRVIGPVTDQVAVFCHGGLGLTWLSYLTGIPLPLMWANFWLSPSSVTTVLFDIRLEGIACPRLLTVADTSHLYAGGRTPKPRGIKANYT